MSRFRLRAALFIGLCGILLLLMPLASGNASDLPTAVTNVKIDQTTAGQFSAVTVDIAFALPADSKVGDTFSVGLPASLILQHAAFPLRAPDGALVASGVVQNGVATFTLTDYVATHSDVVGGAKIDGHFNQSVIKPGQVNDFTFTSGTTQWQSKVGIIVPVASTHAGPQKFGYWTDLSDQGVTKPADALHWIIRSWTGPLTDLVFHDTLGPGQANDCSTLTVVSSTTFDSLGNLTHAQPLGARAVESCSATGFTVTVASVLAKEVVQVSYDGTITDESQNPYTNAVVVSATNKTQPIEASVKHYSASGSASGVVPPPTTTPPPTTATTTPTAPTTTAPSTTPTTTTPTTTTAPSTTAPSTTAPSTTATTSPATTTTTVSSVEASSTSRTTTAVSSVEASSTSRTTTAVSSVEASSTSRTTAVAAATTTNSSALPFTGSHASTLSEVAGSLLLLGSGLMLVGRRRGRHAG